VFKLLRPDTPLYRNYDADFERQLTRPTADRRIPVRWLLEDHETGFRLTLTIKETGTSVSSTTYVQELEPAHTPQADNIRRQLMRLGDTPYTCTEEDIEISFSDNWFIPASVLGEWRRAVVASLGLKHSVRAPQCGTQTECLRPRDEALMTCRHCLRYALGYCTRDGQHLPYREPLSLRLADGRTYPLRFDCKACEMQVLKD
jgi:putative protease